MKALACLPLLAMLGACGSFDQTPAPSIPPVCETQVYADPVVKDLILKGAGSPTFRLQSEDALKYAKIDAVHRCLQQRGLLPPGGGVARPRVTS
jgi:hypothetical protein